MYPSFTWNILCSEAGFELLVSLPLLSGVHITGLSLCLFCVVLRVSSGDLHMLDNHYVD